MNPSRLEASPSGRQRQARVKANLPGRRRENRRRLLPRSGFFRNEWRQGAAAIHFSLLASCKLHGHDPWVYYRDVLTRLPALLLGADEQELLALLPHLWKLSC
jgi:hypothetical protein